LILQISTNKLLYEIGAKANVFKMSTAHVDFDEDVFVSQMFAIGVDIVHLQSPEIDVCFDPESRRSRGRR
jgi:hypothetical protein